MNKFVLSLFASVLFQNAIAQEVYEIQGRTYELGFNAAVATGIVKDDPAKLLENNVTIRLQGDLGRGYQIVSIVSNSEMLDYNFAPMVDLNDRSTENYKLNLKMNNLYVEKKNKNGSRFQVGSLATDEEPGRVTAIATVAWIDGVRMIIPKGADGDIRVTVGHLGNKTTPDVLSRTNLDKWNLLEITLPVTLFKKVAMTNKYSRVDGKNYLQTVAQTDIKVTTEKLISLIIENVRDFNSQKSQRSFGIEVQDVVDFLFDVESGVTLAAYYIKQDNGFVNYVANDTFLALSDKSVVIHASKELNKNLMIFLGFVLNDNKAVNSRIEGGIFYSF